MQVWKIANVDDRAKNIAYEVFQVEKLDGTRCWLQIERDKAFSPDFLYHALLKANVDLPANKRVALDQLEDLISDEPPERWVFARAAGWFEGEPAFLLGDRLIGDSRGAKVYPPDGPHASARVLFSRHGKLGVWQSAVAGSALVFPPWAAAICAVFAAPLMTVCDWPDFQVHCFGGSQRRRFATTSIAGSVSGLDRQHIDELSQLSGDDLHEVARLLAHQAFIIGENTADVAASGERFKAIPRTLLRGNLQAGPTLFPVNDHEWHGVVLSAGVSAHPEAHGGAAGSIGSEARVVNIPISLSTWRDMGLLGPEKLPTRGMQRGCTENSGRAFRRYVQFLVSRFAKLPKLAASAIKEFRVDAIKLHPGLKDSPLLPAFARLYAGGVLAIQAAVVPWSAEQLQAALVACLCVADEYAGRQRASLSRAKRQLNEGLARLPSCESRAVAAFGPKQHAGFYVEHEGVRVYTVHAKSFRCWLGGRAESLKMLAWLHRSGKLNMGGRIVRRSMSATGWAERTVRWPDGRIHRSYVFRGPI